MEKGKRAPNFMLTSASSLAASEKAVQKTSLLVTTLLVPPDPELGATLDSNWSSSQSYLLQKEHWNIFPP